MSEHSLSSHWIDWFIFALKSYQLSVLGVVAYSPTTFRVKCVETDVVLKKIDVNQVETVEYISSLRLPYFEQAVLNNRRRAVSFFGNEYYYIVPYLKDKYYDGKMSEKSVSRLLANLHNQTFHVVEVESGYFEKWTLMFQEKLSLIITHDAAMFKAIIPLAFKSPTQWIWCTSLDIGVEYYNHFQRHITLFQELTKSKNSVRETINWGHFGEDNVDYNKQILLGMHKINFRSPVFDLYDWINTSKSVNLLENLRQYFGYFRLQTYEIHWLMLLLYDFPLFQFGKDEFINVNQIMERRKKLVLIKAIEDILGVKEKVVTS